MTSQYNDPTIAAKIPDEYVDRTQDRYESMPAFVRFLLLAMSGAGAVLAVVYIFGIVPLLDVTYYFLLMAMYLPVAFLLLPAHKRELKAGWLSYLPAMAIFGLTLLMAYQGRNLVFQTWVPVGEPWQLWVASAIFVLILDTARRSGGLIFLTIVLILGLYPIYADYMPGMLWGPPTTLARTIAFNVYSGDAMLGIVTRVVAETIIGFLILAALLVATGAADFFSETGHGDDGSCTRRPCQSISTGQWFLRQPERQHFRQRGQYRFCHHSQYEKGRVSRPLCRGTGSLCLNRWHADATGNGGGRFHHG